MPIDPDVARSWTLSADLYVDPVVLAAEQEKLFSRCWQIVGHSTAVRNAGDFFCAEAAGEPIAVARGEDGDLRAFFNVCRHRAGPPAEGCGNRKVFRCGYHGWTYSLDGRLLAAPEMEETQDFRLEDFGLLPVRTEEWGGQVFVNLDAAASALPQWLGDLPRNIAHLGFERMQLHERREYVMQCNWKTYIDNYLEGYHLPSVHPSLNRELDYNSYVTETFGSYSRQWSPIRPAQDSGDRRYQNPRPGDIADYYWVFPNWMLNCYPDNISLNIVLPLSPEQCVAIFEWYFADDVPAEVRSRTVGFSDEIQVEDGAICEKVQRNLRSRAYTRGRFSAKQERCLHHFHRLWQEWMGHGGSAQR